MVDHRHDVVVRLSAPILIDIVGELLPVAGGTARVWHHDDVAGARETPARSIDNVQDCPHAPCGPP